MPANSRIHREERIVEAMLRYYCSRHAHSPDGTLCADCRELLDYALHRLDRCPFQEGKTTCAQCPVHCYQPDYRARIKTVMRYAGPRMLVHRPIMAIWHLIDGRRKKPSISARRARRA